MRADLLSPVPDRLAQLVELAAQLVRDLRGEALDLQDHAGQGLPDLIMKLTGDPPAL